ncbi:MAG: nitroreductase family protein [Synoicihabitans sp.]
MAILGTMDSKAMVPLNFTRREEAEVLSSAQAHYDMIRSRRTVRQFSSDPVPREVIENCIRAAGAAPSGANLQPWHFVAVGDRDIKRQIREASEIEEREFYASRAPDEWLDVLRPFGTDAIKPYLEVAPWLIPIFAVNAFTKPNGEKQPTYYPKESVGIATGFLINALHAAGLATLTHTPSPMNFLNRVLGRPSNEKAFLLLVVGYPAENAQVPNIARKPLEEIATFI